MTRILVKRELSYQRGSWHNRGSADTGATSLALFQDKPAVKVKFPGAKSFLSSAGVSLILGGPALLESILLQMALLAAGYPGNTIIVIYLKRGENRTELLRYDNIVRYKERRRSRQELP